MAKRILLFCICMSFLFGLFGGFSTAALESVRVDPMVSIGNGYMVALSATGVAYAWGSNQNGVFGNGTTVSSSRPVAVSMPTKEEETLRFSSVSAGYDHVIALATDGTVWTWGSDANGQLGNRNEANTAQSTTTPKQVTGGLTDKKVVAVAAGMSYSLALTSEGKVYAWGSNSFGILGNLDRFLDREGNRLTDVVEPYPTRITALDQPFITALFAGPKTAAAVDSAGQVWLWGDNSTRQAGDAELGEDGVLNVVAVPVKKTSANGYVAASVALGLEHTSFLMLNGTVSGFGSTQNGLLGTDQGITTTTTAVFKPLLAGEISMTAVAAGSSFGASLGTNGRVYVWGKNTDGILNGDLTSETLEAPTELLSAPWETPTFLAAGYDNLAVIDADGTVYTWGKNNKGQLGNNTTSVQASAPVAVLSVSGGSYLSLGAPKDEIKQQTQITMTATVPAPTFAISIPATLGVGSLTQKNAGDTDAVSTTAFEVRASNVDHLFGEKQIVIDVSAPDGVFCLMDEEFPLPYSLYNTANGGEPLQSGDRFAVFLENGTAEGRIEIDQSQITRQGSYSGRILFTVSVAAREEAES